MDTNFNKISHKAINDNVFKLIGKDWMLITAGNKNNINTMTASWGGFGILWNKPVCFIFVRPTRYTYKFIENEANFSLSFFDKEYKPTLQYCGSNSGRDVNKIQETGLTPIFSDNNTPYFNEARLVVECHKLCFNDILPENFLDSSVEKNYPQNNYHRMYIAKIITVLTKV